MVSGGRGLNTGILDSVSRGTNECSVAQRWPHLKCHKKEVEHEKCLGRHCDWEKKCLEGGGETEKGLGMGQLNPEGI